MKILKIFGIVVAVHAVFFVFLFAIPGCRSTTRQVSPSLSPEPIASSAPAPAPIGVASPNLPPAQPSVTAAVSNSELNPGVSSPTPPTDANGTPSIHFNRTSPTRPGTPVANALTAAPVADVTPAKTYTVGKGDSLSLVAKKNGITVSELIAANNLKKDAVLRLGQKLIIPSKTPSSVAGPNAPAASVPSTAAETVTYKVKQGDTLDKIAKNAGVSVTSIKSLNKLKNDKVTLGQELILPAGNNSAAALTASPGADTSTNPPSALKANNTATSASKYVVKQGESLGQIAKKNGVKLSDLAAANNISDPKKIHPGQELIIPGTKSKAAANATTPSNLPTPGPSTMPANSSPNSPVTSPSTTTPPADSSPISAPPDAAPPVIKVDEPPSKN